MKPILGTLIEFDAQFVREVEGSNPAAGIWFEVTV
jgi:hypothetical protein